MDFGMLRNTDVAWMDDRTAPSAHVRHNIDGLSLVFPPAYLLSFLTDLDYEPLHDPPDLPLYVRSRMEGVLGLCFQSEMLLDEDRDAIAEQIALYKSLRPTLATAAAALLTPQADAYAGPAWDVLQETATDGPILLYAFDSYNGANATLVSPMGLAARRRLPRDLGRQRYARRQNRGGADGDRHQNRAIGGNGIARLVADPAAVIPDNAPRDR